MNIYVQLKGNRYLLTDGKRIYGCRNGYKTKRAADTAHWYLHNAKTALKKEYELKGQMANEMKHFKSI
jgi:hypothetical protein